MASSVFQLALQFLAHHWLIIVAVVAVAAVGAYFIPTDPAATSTAGTLDEAGLYKAREALFTPAETVFLRALDRIIPPSLRVFGKVRLGDLFEVSDGVPAALRMRLFNKVAAKHVDFVVVRADDLTPVFAIELDDSSHRAEARQSRDRFVENVFTGAGVPLERVRVTRSYSQVELQRQFSAHIQPHIAVHH